MTEFYGCRSHLGWSWGCQGSWTHHRLTSEYHPTEQATTTDMWYQHPPGDWSGPLSNLIQSGSTLALANNDGKFEVRLYGTEPSSCQNPQGAGKKNWTQIPFSSLRQIFQEKELQFAFYPGLPGSEKLLPPACVQGQLREPRRECLEERHRG